MRIENLEIKSAAVKIESAPLTCGCELCGKEPAEVTFRIQARENPRISMAEALGANCAEKYLRTWGCQ